MRHNLILVVVFFFFTTTVSGQYSLGTGDALVDDTSTARRVNPLKNLPTGVQNRAIRNNKILWGSDFNGMLGRPDDASLQLINDASDEGDASYQEALYNSPWYWNNWNQQSAQFLKEGDRNYFNPAFIDNWSTSPLKMSEGRSIRSYSNSWNKQDAKRYSASNDITSTNNWSSRQEDQYRLGQVLGSGAQSVPFDSSPVQVGRYNSTNSFGYLTASPMSGVSIQTSTQPTAALGFSQWDAARATEDQQVDSGNGMLVKPWRTNENRLEYGMIENRVTVPDQYINVLDAIKDRAQQLVDEDGVDETTIDWLEEQYAALQDELTGTTTQEEVVDEEGQPVEEDTPATEDIYASLQHGERIGTFSGIEQNRFNELVGKGEMAIASGEFFLAEKRFKQALMFIPGHPMATAGLGHANLGSGLYLSASHVLQSLFTFQPEMIDVMYEPQLLPPRIDLVRAAVAIRNRLDEKRDGGTYAFLLAYIGYQLQDAEMIEAGIAELERRANKDDPIVPMLKYIWLPSQKQDGVESQTE